LLRRPMSPVTRGIKQPSAFFCSPPHRVAQQWRTVSKLRRRRVLPGWRPPERVHGNAFGMRVCSRGCSGLERCRRAPRRPAMLTRHPLLPTGQHVVPLQSRPEEVLLLTLLAQPPKLRCQPERGSCRALTRRIGAGTLTGIRWLKSNFTAGNAAGLLGLAAPIPRPLRARGPSEGGRCALVAGALGRAGSWQLAPGDHVVGDEGPAVFAVTGW